MGASDAVAGPSVRRRASYPPGGPPNRSCPSLTRVNALTGEPTPPVLNGTDEASAAFFTEHGWVLTETLGPDGVEELRCWVEAVAEWPDGDGGWIHHRERTEHGPALCRSENFTPFHWGLRSLLREGAMVDVASNLLGEPALLYKEKINYKLPGGAGYSPHQDAPAYPFIDTHVSCMVAVDDADAANGCLEVVDAAHGDLLAVDDTGCIRADVVASMTWITVPVAAGQTLWFHSRTPHRSGPNHSDHPRRALYPTYNARREGDLREQYYAAKLAEFERGGRADGGVRVSLIDDFQGRAL
jgi:hypothetical protein